MKSGEDAIKNYKRYHQNPANFSKFTFKILKQIALIYDSFKYLQAVPQQPSHLSGGFCIFLEKLGPHISPRVRC